MTFRVGQKICCVDDSHSRADCIRELVAGKVYVVRWSGRADYCGQEYHGVRLEGVPRDDPRGGYTNNVDQPFGAHRFRPIVERKTSIEIFKRMLNPSQVDANA